MSEGEREREREEGEGGEERDGEGKCQIEREVGECQWKRWTEGGGQSGTERGYV